MITKQPPDKLFKMEAVTVKKLTSSESKHSEYIELSLYPLAVKKMALKHRDSVKVKLFGDTLSIAIPSSESREKTLLNLRESHCGKLLTKSRALFEMGIKPGTYKFKATRYCSTFKVDWHEFEKVG